MRYRAKDAIAKPVRGRPNAVSSDVITAAKAIAESGDLQKDSFCSTDDLMSTVYDLIREEQDSLGRNPYCTPRVLNRSTTTKLVKIITPITVDNGSIQNSTRQKALMDVRNAISCAATWNAISEGIRNGNFVNIWDECDVMLNEFNQKQKLLCTESGREKLTEKNLAPSTTETQHQRRILKMGLSKITVIFVVLSSLL